MWNAVTVLMFHARCESNVADISLYHYYTTLSCSSCRCVGVCTKDTIILYSYSKCAVVAHFSIATGKITSFEFVHVL